ncbi:MAG: acyl-CoA dehydrogenase family protein [Lautropia sp.]
MDFDVSEDIQSLDDSLRRLLAERYTFRQRRQYLAQAPGWSRDVWKAYAALGVLGLTVPERCGGFGRGCAETMLVLGSLGRALALEPVLPHLLCIRILSLADRADARVRELLCTSVAGDLVMAWAHPEGTARNPRRTMNTTASRESGSDTACRISGIKHLVLAGDTADWLLVSVRIGDRPDAPIGIALVNGAARGVSRRPYELQDGTRAADVRFDDAPGELVVTPERARDALAQVHATGVAAVCATAVGAMDGALATTVAYTRVRKQFGRAISEFQVLQHRMAEMYIGLEQSRSAAMLAASVADHGDPERSRQLSVAKLVVGRHGRFVCQQAVQLHGGIGMTEECVVAHYLRRQHVCESLFGDPYHHLSRLASSACPSALPTRAFA